MIETVNFLVVDDHPVFRQGLIVLIESNETYKVTGQAGSVQEALELLDSNCPDIVLVDISLPDQNGLDLVRSIKGKNPGIPILIISMHDELIYAERALKSGASGYIMKQEASTVMLDAIETVLDGRVYVSSVMNERLLKTIFTNKDEKDTHPIERLSERELEVLEYIGQGYGASEISEILNLSVKTVNTYRDHIKDKLQLSGAAEVRRYAVKWYQSHHR